MTIFYFEVSIVLEYSHIYLLVCIKYKIYYILLLKFVASVSWVFFNVIVI